MKFIPILALMLIISSSAHAKLFKAQLFSYQCDGNFIDQEADVKLLKKLAKEHPKRLEYSRTESVCGKAHTMVEMDEHGKATSFGIYFEDEKSCRCFLFGALEGVVMNEKLNVSMPILRQLILEARKQK